ncbi:MAG: hypothetical protein L0Y71_03830 [Gemmataceae bacterium]|nr:hypothetical protein [Gemmataceae bacterium]
MRYRSLVFVLLLAGVAVAGYVAARTLGIWSVPGQVRPVPPGDQEIAWILPATSGDAWERLVAALKLLQQDWPKLQPGTKLELDLDKAFLDLTADVPEIGLRLGPGGRHKLWVRWYKLSGDTDSRQWINTLRQRGTPPLAVVGGDTSDRALALATALADARKLWSGPAPLLLITTATADRYFPKDGAAITAHEHWPKLMGVYAGRSFRFAFTNQRMVDAVLDFIRQTPQVWPQKNLDPGVLAGIVAPADPWASLGLLGATGHLPYFLYAMEWGDDGYSKDLAEIFLTEFAEQTGNYAGNVHETSVPYSVGDQFQANPREDLAISFFLNDRARVRDQQYLLVLPTGAQRMRRFLRTLCRQAPLEMRNVVVVNGDAISFNTIYRDRDVAWHILDVPVPLVFFSHRSPVDEAAGFHPQKAATGTQDLLLFRDIFEALLHCCFDGRRGLAGTDAVHERLARLRWDRQRVRLPATAGPANGLPFFDADGDRTPGTGAHVVWLRPTYDGTRNLPRAVISVWNVAGQGWAPSCPPFDVFYNRQLVPAGE